MTETMGLKVIGYFVWWTINGVKIARSAFKDLLTSVGLSYDMKDDSEHEVALKREAFLKATRQVKITSKDILIRKIHKSADAYVFGLVDESINPAATSLTYAHAATMRFNPRDGTVSCDHPHRAYDEVMKLYGEYYGYLDSHDIRDILLTLVKGFHCVGVRARGGIYFLPEACKEGVEQIEKLVALLPSSEECYLAVAPQIDLEKSKNSIYKAFLAGLKNKIETFKAELDQPDTDRKATKKWETRLEAFKEVKAEIDFYSEALHFQANDLATELNKLTEKVMEKLA